MTLSPAKMKVGVKTESPHISAGANQTSVARIVRSVSVTDSNVHNYVVSVAAKMINFVSRGVQAVFSQQWWMFPFLCDEGGHT